LLVEYSPDCSNAYFGQLPSLFHESAHRLSNIHVLQADGNVTELVDWSTLKARLALGKGLEDLVCLPCEAA